ncbi:hypothetical protein [Vibrio splendidus]|uniref:hypothetical protein n=1 Tax=Vibrio splendidus TaxID=29497 RepID=UPI000C862C3D|nr:hypothetical protein [Vibrio splendidus]PMI50055.1 hypothetical protein BCU42_12210 [Vibrio splendidus]
MKLDKGLITTVPVFFVGYLFATITNAKDVFDQISAIGSIFAGVGTIALAIFAFKGLDAWKNQFYVEQRFNFLSQYLVLLNQYEIYLYDVIKKCAGPEHVLNEDLLYGCDEMTILRQWKDKSKFYLSNKDLVKLSSNHRVFTNSLKKLISSEDIEYSENHWVLVNEEIFSKMDLLVENLLELRGNGFEKAVNKFNT